MPDDEKTHPEHPEHPQHPTTPPAETPPVEAPPIQPAEGDEPGVPVGPGKG